MRSRWWLSRGCDRVNTFIKTSEHRRRSHGNFLNNCTIYRGTLNFDITLAEASRTVEQMRAVLTRLSLSLFSRTLGKIVVASTYCDATRMTCRDKKASIANSRKISDPSQCGYRRRLLTPSARGVIRTTFWYETRVCVLFFSPFRSILCEHDPQDRYFIF